MDNHSIIIRVAKPTFDEGLVFARYLDEAAEGLFSFMLGRRAPEIIAKAFMQPGHDHSFQNVIFAEHDKVIAGMASGYTAKQHQCFSDQPLKKAAGGWSLRMITVGILFASLLKVLDTVNDGDFYLQAIAIDKEFRGKGIGSALIDFIEDRACAGEARRLSLDVLASNEGAHRLYERRGMTIESQWPKHLTIPGLKLFRMTKTL
jgi:ribosomal protein S18 acetylase RimI-like enzyme